MHLIARPARHTRARRRASRDANAIHTASSSPRPRRASSGIVRASNETGNESNSSPGRIRLTLTLARGVWKSSTARAATEGWIRAFGQNSSNYSPAASRRAWSSASRDGASGRAARDAARGVSGGGKPSGGDESASSASYAGASSVLGYQPAPGEGKDKNIIDNLLRTHDIVHLAEKLEAIGKSRETMTHAVRTSTSPPSSDAETASKVRLLEQSGRVLVLEDMVYLHPREVTQAVLRVLPGVPSKVYGMSNAELEQLKTEFDSMTKHYETARRRAESRSRTIVSSGLIVLCLQLAAFVRLTYYEFSWDVMEPLSYFVGLANAIAVYVYYLWNRRDFSYETWQSSLEGKYAERALHGKGFDINRYGALARRLRRSTRK